MVGVAHIEEPLLKNLQTFVAFARKRVGDPHLAEDVVQECLLKALRSDPSPLPTKMSSHGSTASCAAPSSTCIGGVMSATVRLSDCKPNFPNNPMPLPNESCASA